MSGNPEREREREREREGGGGYEYEYYGIVQFHKKVSLGGIRYRDTNTDPI